MRKGQKSFAGEAEAELDHTKVMELLSLQMKH